MDSKGLEICNSLDQDKACWRGCCQDGRKEACHECLDSVAVVLLALLAPVQFMATKLGKEAQAGPAEYLATSASVIMSKGQYSFEAQCSLPCLTTLTAASTYQADQSMLDQSLPNIIAPNHLWGNWAKAPFPLPLCIFSSFNLK